MGVSLKKVPTDVEVTAEILPPAILPVTDTVAATMVPEATSDVVVMLVVAARFTVDTDVRFAIVLDKPKVMLPLAELVVRLVSDIVKETTPWFTMVMMPAATEFDKPLPVSILAVVNDDASVNTLVKLFCILPKAVYRLSLPVGLFGAPMLMLS